MVQLKGSPWPPILSSTNREITLEEERLAGILAKVLAGSAAVTFDGDRDEYCWGLQRTITNLRRRVRFVSVMPKHCVCVCVCVCACVCVWVCMCVRDVCA